MDFYLQLQTYHIGPIQRQMQNPVVLQYILEYFVLKKYASYTSNDLYAQ